MSNSFIESCDDNQVKYTSSITTNGFLLSEETVDMLLKNEVRHYQVTVDGPRALHNLNRHLIGGGGTYDQIMTNLSKMHERNDKFSVTIRVNFNDSILSILDEFLSELSMRFAGDLRFHVSFHQISKKGGENDWKLDVCDDKSAWLKSLYLNWKTTQAGFVANSFKETLRPGGTVCYAGRDSSIVIRTDGKICKCTVALEDPRNIVGRLDENGNMLIDQYLWDLWVNVDDKDTTKCKTCSFSASCQSRSCPLSAIHAKEPPCPFNKEEYESAVKFSALGELPEPLIPKLRMLNLTSS